MPLRVLANLGRMRLGRVPLPGCIPGGWGEGWGVLNLPREREDSAEVCLRKWGLRAALSLADWGSASRRFRGSPGGRGMR